MLQKLRDHAQRLKRETMALYFAARDPATPWYAKAFVAFVVAYALSPIDPIPDFIPVLGFVDEIILLPFALAFAIRLIPPSVMEAARIRASEEISGQRPRSYTAAVVIVMLWITAIVLTSWVVYRAW
ncbi:MAG TPA: YkvA family protein [Burkholderiales bacterium]